MKLIGIERLVQKTGEMQTQFTQQKVDCESTTAQQIRKNALAAFMNF